MTGRPPKPEPIGARHSRLTVIAESPDRTGNKHRSVCRCDCGNETTVQTSRLRAGYVHSCGCLLVDTMSRMLSTHRMTKSAEYRAWINMRLRCYSTKDIGYRNYGQRGITVCDAWRDSFEQFLADVGMKPSAKHSLERIDTNGNYEVGNVRWATIFEQSNNKRTTVRLTILGITKPISEWGRIYGLAGPTIKRRIAMGWSAERAVTAPRLRRGRQRA